MANLVSLYNHLPYSLKVLAASIRGYQLQQLRYVPGTDTFVVEARNREFWSAEQWIAKQEKELAQFLWHAAKHVPYYRSYWHNRRSHGDNSTEECLQNWPILTKETLRVNNRAFLADDVSLRSQVMDHTSGTTGKPLTLWMSKDAVRQWYTLFEARWRNWYGLTRHDRWGILGGQLVTPFSQNKPPFWVWNAGMSQLYLSSYHLSPSNIPAYLDALRKHRLAYLLGYASSLYSLAQMSLEQKLAVPRLKVVISNAEPLYVHQRELISRAFECPVYDTYGQSENVCAASECLHGNLHLWPEVGLTEILDDEKDIPVAAGETGRIICTGLLNKTMPLIRYEVGDRGFLSKESSCACGRNLPILGCIEGRKDDVLVTKDGRRIGRLDPVFKTDLPIREAQIIQSGRNQIRVRYVPTSECSPKALSSLVQRLKERLGEMEIELEEVEQIPRSPNGKFRAVVSEYEL